ncbi:MAG: T9SS type A sorting domain-containing protein [Bacteroidetes bacterium]|nr:T9SS type A sorting domain-containing protein [Bacteroidota bacterium]
MKRIVSIFMVMSLAVSAWAQCDGRYESEIFDDVEVTTVVYSDVYDLDVDIYEPVGDTETSRPLILFAHGGSFYGGTPSAPAMISLCEAFAKRGYVTASIQYRLTTAVSLTDSIVMLQTVMNAIGDSKAAVRYFRKDVAENGNTFGVDADQIYFGGYSAGAIMAVNHAFIDETDVLPTHLVDIVAEAGGLEGNSGNEGYSSEVKAVISLAGGVYQTSFIDADDEPIVSLHATNDGTVDYLCGDVMQSGVGGIIDMVNLCGSGSVHNQADAVGVYNELHTFSSGDHSAPWTNMEQVSIPFISDFIYTTLDCYEGVISVEEEALAVEVFPNPVSDMLTVNMIDMESVCLLDVMGRVVLSESARNNTHQLNVQGLASGVYVLQVASENHLWNQRLFVK